MDALSVRNPQGIGSETHERRKASAAREVAREAGAVSEGHVYQRGARTRRTSEAGEEGEALHTQGERLERAGRGIRQEVEGSKRQVAGSKRDAGGGRREVGSGRREAADRCATGERQQEAATGGRWRVEGGRWLAVAGWQRTSGSV